MTSKDYIGVFDSGVGGISVLRHLRQMMPGERYLYFGDTANAPYGCRPTEEVRRRFVADASHELKTPLASIRLLSDSILQSQNMDAEMMREFVGDIGSEADRLARVTEHLLELTRLDSLPTGETSLVDVSQVARKAANMLAPVADAAGVTVELNLKQDCTILCTEDELYQVCFNLMETFLTFLNYERTVSVKISCCKLTLNLCNLNIINGYAALLDKSSCL